MGNQTLGERLPEALKRIGRFLGSDLAAKLNKEFLADLMAIHAVASERAMPGTPCWVIMEGGWDWEEVVGVYLKEEDASKVHAELIRNLKKKQDSSPNGYGVSMLETKIN